MLPEESEAIDEKKHVPIYKTVETRSVAAMLRLLL